MQKCSAHLLSYGRLEDATVRILEGSTSQGGTRLCLQTPRGKIDLELALQGDFQLYNATAAVTAGLALEIEPDIIAEALREIRIPGRFEGIDCGQNFGVFVDYAHAPDGLKNVLQTARAFARGQLICVFGCGGDRDKGKRPVMGGLSAKLADLSVVTSDNPRTEDPDAIIADILPGLGDAPHIVEPNRRRAIEKPLQKRGQATSCSLRVRGTKIIRKPMGLKPLLTIGKLHGKYSSAKWGDGLYGRVNTIRCN